ncbi:MAG: 3-dehydroquinate synthase [Bacteroidales bacterium]|nr:3-dehydroquinate synthase [Bacteroidales bacterium]
MENILIQGSAGESSIVFNDSFRNFRNYIPSTKKAVVITDATISKLYRNVFEGIPVIEIGEGEKNKTFQTLEKIFGEFLKLNVDRSWFIIGAGGELFAIYRIAASIYMRGLPFGFVSTTLLSQVDASVGGKNGVNFGEFKNMVGVFAQPSFVICDPEILETLSEREYISGFAEIIKAAAIRNIDLLDYLEQHITPALNKDRVVLGKLIYESVKIKANVVQQDEKETGERRILNFGHTFAHSIELYMGLTHGEAVAIGMVLASRASVKMELLKPDEAERLKKLIENFGLPTRFNLDKSLVYSTLLKDKKREGDSINLVLLEGMGSAVVRKVSLNQMEEIVNDLC